MTTLSRCPQCKHFVCVCSIINRHDKACPYRLAAACSIAIECIHGYDVCPVCDPCTCESLLAA